MPKENIYNELYERAKNGEHFTNLMSLVLSRQKEATDLNPSDERTSQSPTEARAHWEFLAYVYKYAIGKNLRYFADEPIYLIGYVQNKK